MCQFHDKKFTIDKLHVQALKPSFFFIAGHFSDFIAVKNHSARMFLRTYEFVSIAIFCKDIFRTLNWKRACIVRTLKLCINFTVNLNVKTKGKFLFTQFFHQNCSEKNIPIRWTIDSIYISIEYERIGTKIEINNQSLIHERKLNLQKNNKSYL